MKKKPFDLYQDIKQKLIRRGIPPNEIAFIHDAKSPEARERIFNAVRAGQIRVLIGSTAKMGTGMNVQDKLIAMHHLDAPWRPADVEQRQGRILRQGNSFQEVFEFVYITTGSFDGYIWQVLETKARFIDQVMSGQVNSREIDDISKTALSMAEIKALASGDPEIMKMIAVENELTKLDSVRGSWLRNRQLMQMKLESHRQQEKGLEKRIALLRQAIQLRDQHQEKDFRLRVLDKEYQTRKEAGAALNRAFLQYGREGKLIGKYRGFPLQAQLLGSIHDPIEMNIRLQFGEGHSLRAKVGESGLATMQSVDAVLRGLEGAVQKLKSQSEQHGEDITAIESGLNQPWDEANRYTQLKEDLVILKQRVLKDENNPEDEASVQAETSAEVKNVEEAQEEAPHILRPTEDGELNLSHILSAVQSAEHAAFPDLDKGVISLDEEAVRNLEAEASSTAAFAQFSRAALDAHTQQPSFGDWLQAHAGQAKVNKAGKRSMQPVETAQLTFF
jgi:superfamily II DNA/RNA helicase